MPDSCCVPNCTNRRKKGDGSGGFFRIPSKKYPDVRKRWLTAIGRVDWPEQLIGNAKVCHLHFTSGKKSKDPLSPDFVPSVFDRIGKKMSEEKKKEKQDRFQRARLRVKQRSNLPVVEEPSEVLEPEEEELSPQDMEIEKLKQKVTEIENVVKEKENNIKEVTRKYCSIQNELVNRMAEIHQLKNKNNLSRKFQLNYKHLKSHKNYFYFYTGLDQARFNWVFAIIKNKMKRISRILTPKDHLVVVLVKLKLGLYNKDIAFRFGITCKMVTKIYRSLLKVLSKSLLFLIVWPEKEAIRKHMPKCFKKYLSCRCIIDCTEIFIQRPLNLNARAQTWSNYKNTNTIKYLVACSPTGSVSFLSEGWGGRVSDKEITIKSGFLDLVENGDLVLADRGFLIEQELATRGVVLKIPEFTRGKEQMSAMDVDRSRKIANVRIHIERVIGRLRKFEILNTTIPITQVDLLDDVFIVICALVNLNKGII
ncbi:uncharacterized protein LOC130628692 [Hydractinia symbiolongicarpus]|uniref:uncharacterized protein LOC130628692 n=1 Tax=Hydractinia symbiolongicarpus TaxID=13093 RepID=UPI00255107E1|nr:uncharacterized protein LOC130628692 [Hydractinia symbiolongicarpus]